jgi:hypothetical protein
LVAALSGVRRGSTRGTLVWLGLLGYIWYTYTGAAFAYHFNELFLVYVALFSLSTFALITACSGLKLEQLRQDFDEGTPRRAVATFLGVLAFLLCLLWLGQITPFFTKGQLPAMITRADTPTVFVYVLDLGIVVPLALLAAWYLRSDGPWGYPLAGLVLTKAAMMGLALVSITWFTLRAGQEVEPALGLVWVSLALSGIGMSVWFLRHART